MTKKKIFIILAVAVALLVVAASAVIIKSKSAKKPIKGDVKKSEQVIPKSPERGAVNIPKIPKTALPPPIDVNKLLPPKSLELPPAPPKLPALPANVPQHIDIESLKAPVPNAPSQINK